MDSASTYNTVKGTVPLLKTTNRVTAGNKKMDSATLQKAKEWTVPPLKRTRKKMTKNRRKLVNKQCHSTESQGVDSAII